MGGGGTDFPSYYLVHGGYFFGFALASYVHVAIHDTIDKQIRVKYSKTEIVDDVDDLENRVAAEALKWYGITKGIEIVTVSDVPEASGLGGSSAFCVALVASLRYRLGLSLDPVEIMASAYEIERIKANIPGGIQDHFFAANGGAWAVSLGDETIQKPMDVVDLLPHLKLIYTNTHRMNLTIAMDQTQKVNEGDSNMLANLSKIKELGQHIEQLIRQKRYNAVGKIMHTHWEEKKQRHPEITNPIVDHMYSLARSNGATGGKLLGLGGGGYVMVYCPDGHLKGIDCLDVNIDMEGVKVCYAQGG